MKKLLTIDYTVDVASGSYGLANITWYYIIDNVNIIYYNKKCNDNIYSH